MTKSNLQVFAQNAGTDVAVCTAACTTYGDTANKVLLSTGGANDSDIVRIGCLPRATVTATQIQLYLSKDGGATMSLIGLAQLPAYTMAQTTAPSGIALFTHIDGTAISDSAPLRLSANSGTPDRLYIAIGVALAAGVVFFAERKDY